MSLLGNNARKGRLYGATRRGVLGQLALTPFVVAAMAHESRPHLAMWVWKDRILVPDDMARFADAHHIETLFVYVSPNAAEALLRGDRGAVAAVERMRERGRRVYAVAGEPDWARGPTILPRHADLLVRLMTKPSHFDGLHFDVEPNALAEWQSPLGRRPLLEGTLRFYDLLRAAAPAVPIDAAVNPVFATLATTTDENFLGEIARRVDSVSIMAYRNNVSRALDWSHAAVEQAIAKGRDWRIGVLVTNNPDEPGTSWYGVPRKGFDSAMQQLDKSLVARYQSAHYAGLVFEDYDGLTEMFAY